MHGIEISETDHRLLITVDTDIIDRTRIERALRLLESDVFLDEGLSLAMQESADDDEVDLEEAKRIVGRK